jgi:hypothetical protein
MPSDVRNGIGGCVKTRESEATDAKIRGDVVTQCRTVGGSQWMSTQLNPEDYFFSANSEENNEP